MRFVESVSIQKNRYFDFYIDSSQDRVCQIVPGGGGYVATEFDEYVKIGSDEVLELLDFLCELNNGSLDDIYDRIQSYQKSWERCEQCGEIFTDEEKCKRCK